MKDEYMKEVWLRRLTKEDREKPRGKYKEAKNRERTPEKESFFLFFFLHGSRFASGKMVYQHHNEDEDEDSKNT